MVNTLHDGGQAEQREGYIKVPVWHTAAAGVLAVPVQHLLLFWQAKGFQIGTDQAFGAIDVHWHVVGQAAVGQIRQRVAKGSQLPVEDGHDFGFGWMQHQVADTEVAVGDGGAVVRRDVIRQPLHQGVHGRHVVGAAGFKLAAPALELTGDVVVWLAVAFQTNSFPVGIVQLAHGLDHRLIDRHAFFLRDFGQLWLRVDATVNVVHHIEGGTDDLGVFTQQMDAGYRHISATECVDHLVLTLDHVCRRQ